MERLRHDDPTQIGPYATLARLDADHAERTVPERRYLARGGDGERTVLVCVPRVGADPSRWAIGAEGARRLPLPGFLNVAEVGGSAGFPWSAAPYTPALPLPAVLAAYGGPLPEDTVRGLGAGLARGLAAAHARGVVHAGPSPAAVLVTAGGPLLTCRGAALGGLDGLDPGCVAPELASGEADWTAAGDLFALGAVLAYAATGHTVPERSELPSGLRRLVTACLSRDAADRPASAVDLLRELADPAAPADTVLIGAAPLPGLRPGPRASNAGGAEFASGGASNAGEAEFASGGAGYAPLPGRVVAALASQSAALLAAEIPVAQKVH